MTFINQMAAARSLLKDVVWCNSPYEAAEGADLILLLTEWNVYRALDLRRISKTMRGNVLFDARNVYGPRRSRGPACATTR